MILVIQAWLPHYRLEFFNALCALDEVVVVHSGKPTRREADKFEEVILPVKSVGPFYIQERLLEVVASRRPSAVIAMFDLRWVNTIRSMYRFDREVAWVWWGLNAGKSGLATRVKLLIAQRNNPIVFYHEAIRRAFMNEIADSGRLFVANNTVHVPIRQESFRNPDKNRIINVSSLDARRQTDVTIRVFKRICDDTGADIRLTLIGDGPERDALRVLTDSLDMLDRVEFVGKIDDPTVLAIYYSEAIASVSFGAAGLAVLQSMAFGVPFITKRNAISGGEKDNIVDGVNGLLCDDSSSSLEASMRKLIENIEYARSLGNAAYDYYWASATIENMVNNFSAAIAFRRGSDA